MKRSTLTSENKVSLFPTTLVWPKVGQSGIVPIDSCVPNPNNARKHFDDDELLELAESIKKGSQREVATVRELWDHEKSHYPHARYMIVSGERRWRASRIAGETTYDIRVKAYKDLAAEGLEGFMLNESRVGLSDLEMAWEIDRLAKLHGWETHAEIALNLNKKNSGVITQILSLLKLSPKVQARMHPSVRIDDRLRKQVGVWLSGKPHDVQDDLITRLPPQLKAAAHQISWLDNQLRLQGIVPQKRERDPVDMREMLQMFSRTMQHKADDLREAPGFDRLFENTSDREAQNLARELRVAHSAFGTIVARVEELSRAQKRQTMLVPRATMPQHDSRSVRPAPVAPPVPAMRRPLRVVPAERVAQQIAREVAEPHRKAPGVSTADYVIDDSSRTSPILSSRSRGGLMVNVHYEFMPGKFRGDRVDLRTYCKLHDAGKLMYQVQGGSKPSNYPERKDILGL